MSTNPTPRRPRQAKPDDRDGQRQGQGHFAPYFDRDSLSLSYLYEHGHISRTEFRDNLRALGVKLGDDDIRRIPVPQVVSIVATGPHPPPQRETEPPPEEGDEPWDPWADEQEEDS